MEQFVCFNQCALGKIFAQPPTSLFRQFLENVKKGETRVCLWVYGFCFFVCFLASVQTLFAFNLMPLFFQTPLIKADEKLQASPDVGGSPDTSDTGFEEAMDVSDGNSDFIFWACFGKLFDQGFII